ncbi:hypothetical protein KKJ06_22230 [Xenorhabdus bovienii]|uniref:hypothetical protein n=1 Tax=Xenorhabdus bovienii TaxID=40576 RepID=UPI0023B21672|nr:hypothetical protein [Xenorhabdus bovienii]MDE9456173.1 hypothetical protein [Xenorhabdus bovienii]MDE9467304.1 hypothetical protein [Xenorhabdus bovienii]MDE9542857.1 hypothetical protein [Xenorhabdus bovienii]MDE9552708.1 hypothetical protein [Xenorhabdus bovienii]MDE9558015.1 hypothetical protein [Xenorhabdus bovienii]
MKNKLEDLNNHLFAQLERLSDESISGEQLETEIRRAKSVSDISTQVINNGKLVLDIHKALSNQDIDSLPKYLGGQK